MITKGKYSNYMSCGLAHEMVACFYNFCVTNLPYMGIWVYFSIWLCPYCSKLRSHVSCFPTLDSAMGKTLLSTKTVEYQIVTSEQVVLTCHNLVLNRFGTQQFFF